MGEQRVLRALAQAAREEFPRGTTVELRTEEMALRCGSISAVVGVEVVAEQVTASYDLNGVKYLAQYIGVAVVLAVVGAVWSGSDGMHAVKLALALFGVTVLWVGYGNLYLNFYGMTRLLNRSLKKASESVVSTPAS